MVPTKQPFQMDSAQQKTLSTKEISAILVQVVEQYPSIQLAILYGSTAQGTVRLDSDIDLAVAAGDKQELDQTVLIDLSVDASKRTSREVQVRDIARAQGLFLKEIMTKGVVIYQTDPTVRGHLIVRMLDFVEDFLPLVSMIRTAKRERFLA